MAPTSQVQKAESRFLLLVGTFAILFGVPAVLSFLKAPDVQSLSVQKLEARTPASVSTQEGDSQALLTAAVPASNSTSLIQYDCESTSLQEEVRGSYVRFTGLPCKNVEDLEITNQTNGFSAAVIFTKGHKFTTDFIDLKEGENDLLINVVQSDGTKVAKTFKVVRRVPASVIH